MKTRSHPSRFFESIRLPEIITWIIGLLFFVLMILSLDLPSQTQGQSLKDTVWLRTGEVIPCIILDGRSYSTDIYVKRFDATGQWIKEKYPFSNISYFKKDTSDIDRSSLRDFSVETKSPKIYVAFGGGWPGNAGISLTFLTKNDMGGSISYRFRRVKSNKEPSDYHGGIFSIGTPGDQAVMLSACFVKVFPNKTTRRVRIGLEAGPSLITYAEASFSRGGTFLFGANYRVHYTKKKTVGLTFRTAFEFPFTQVFGLELALIGNINPIRSFAGIEIYITLGRLRDKIKP